MKLRDKIKHKQGYSTMWSILNLDVEADIDWKDIVGITTAKNENVKRLWEQLYQEIYLDVTALHLHAGTLPEDRITNGILEYTSKLLRTIEQYRE